MSIKDFTEKLASSGLTLEDAEKLHIEYYTAEQTKHYANYALEQPSMRFQYYDPFGYRYDFDEGRIRYLGELSGFASLTKKPRRFLQKKNARPLPYFPQLINWSDIINDSDVPIYITEGELKAAILCKHNLPCIGLGGVYNWSSKSRDMPIIPELQRLNLQNRRITLVFDADTKENNQVQQALIKFSDQLMSKLGAIPQIIDLPTVNDDPKTGVDDFIVEKGIDVFLDLPIMEYQKHRSLAKFNEKCVFIKNTQSFYDIDNRLILNRVNALTLYCDVRISVRNKKDQYVEKSLFNEWNKWRGRRSVNKLVFDPSLPPFEITNEYLNMWKGFPVEPEQGDITLWNDLMEHLIPKENREYIEKWIAWRFQNPGIKPFTALVLWSREQGTGKSTFCRIVCNLLGDYATVIQPYHLMSQFNGYMANNLITAVEEIYGNERNSFVNKLKTYITQDKVQINEKGVPLYELDDYTGFIFSSNNSNAVYFDNHDRRYHITHVTRKKLSFKKGKEINEYFSSEKGKGALMHYFLTMDLSDFDARDAAHHTLAKAEMLRANLSPFESWLDQVTEDGLFEVCALYTSSQLAGLYALESEDRNPPTNIRITKILRDKLGFVYANKGKPIAHQGKVARYFVMNRGSLENANHSDLVFYLETHSRELTNF